MNVGAGITVVGLAADDAGGTREVFRETLRQGVAPRRQLREAGFRASRLPHVTSDADDAVLAYEVTSLPASSRTPCAHATEKADLVRQRLAAYAVVTSERGVLLTRLSQTTGRPGLWILPGGGVDAGEHPAEAVVREVWEEAGQDVELGELVDVSSSHRVGIGRGDAVEDFHAVRLLFTASCPQPSEPVVHDIGGSTESAAWFSIADAVDPEAPGYPEGGMASWALDAVRAFADGP